MTFEDHAKKLATRVRSGGRAFLTVRREELREGFGIGKLTEGLSAQLCEALNREGILVHPSPYGSGPSIRLFDERQLLGQIAAAIVAPDTTVETSLREAGEMFARDAAGRALRSHDAPWIRVFDLFLQVALGREPEGWEELRHDRHPVTLARELAAQLGLSATTSDDPATLRIAAAVCAFRPRREQWSARSFVANDDLASAASFLALLVTTNQRLHEEHGRLLRVAARLLVGSDTIPEHQVELGALGLRYRVENNHTQGSPA